MMENFLVFENISKSFGEQVALDSISFAIRKGEIFSLLGPSGCGKTTLLRIAAGFERPDTGRVLLNGRDISALPPNKRNLNTVFQNYALFPHLNVWDNIAFGLRVSGQPQAVVAAEVGRMLSLTRLEPHAAKKPAQLSGGQRQRTAIARALVNKPDVLLLDEPLAALDLKLRQHLLLELVRLHEQVGTTFVYVTHDQDEAMGSSNRLAVLNDGKIEQIGSPFELYEHPRTSFVAGFIGDANFFDGVALQTGEHDDCEISVPSIGSFPAKAAFPVTSGMHLRLQLRPEKLEVHLAQPEVGSQQRCLEGRISEIMYFGSFSKCWVTVGQMRLAATVSHTHGEDQSARLEPGARAWLRWRTTDLVVVACDTIR